METDLTKRLRWQCRRGMTELDRLLVWWLDHREPGAVDEQRRAFAELLQSEDTELWQWFVGRAEPARSDWKHIVDDVRASYRP